VSRALDLKTMKVKLEEKRKELLENVARARAMGSSDSDAVSPDIADRATNAFQREFSFSLSENETKMLRLIDQALGRMAEGKYGRCTNCGDPIEEPRLEAIPWARHCIACQELQDRGEL
jgi:DnaK suppressor protein